MNSWVHGITVGAFLQDFRVGGVLDLGSRVEGLGFGVMKRRNEGV